jgi:hypothetical protein
VKSDETCGPGDEEALRRRHAATFTNARGETILLAA